MKDKTNITIVICPDDIDNMARCLCEDFDITDKLCSECWDSFIAKQPKEEE